MKTAGIIVFLEAQFKNKTRIVISEKVRVIGAL